METALHKNIKCPIITPHEWGARPAKSVPVIVPKALEIIFHHTDSHHREISNPANESVAEAKRFARDIQRFHMDPPPHGRGWNDTGQNFTITRGGQILAGRWYTVTAIQHGHMVESAHCPEHNGSIGIEHEHLPGQTPPFAQIQASALLQAWIADMYNLPNCLPVHGHSMFFNTRCPDNLREFMDQIRQRAQIIYKGV